MDDRIEQWLDERGYSLEMRVAQVLRKTEMSVLQSEFYTDVESKQSRETDVVAYHDERRGIHQLFVFLVIECKVSGEKPWVLFTHDNRYPSQLAIERHAFTPYTRAAVHAVAANTSAQELELFALPSRTAYSMVVAFGDQNDKAYSAVMSVLSATKGLVEDLRNRNSSNNLHAFGIPVIVVKGRLFEAFLDAADEMSIEEISKGVLVWRNPVLGSMSTVTIVTESAFSDLGPALARDCATFAKLVGAELLAPKSRETAL